MRSRSRRLAAAALLLSVAIYGGCAPDDAGNGFHSEVHRLMDQERYRNASWNLVMTELGSGDPAELIRPDAYFVPGSTAKLFSAGAALEEFGAQSRVTTPVYATTKPSDGKVSGDLVLVASGDLNLGGRSAETGLIEYSNSDHNEADVLPRVTLTVGDPLAGLDNLAGQVRASGVGTVEGNVIVDDRLFAPFTKWNDGIISPIMLNDNVIDLTITPTTAGSTAAVSQRPFVSGYAIDSSVMTGPADAPPSVVIQRRSDGRIEATGTVPAGTDPVIRIFKVEDPAAFARSALIDALRRAGVVVNAQPGQPNQSGSLPAPGSYEDNSRVAALESATLADEVKVILKVSFNRGADLLVCRLAVASGSKDCIDGMARMEQVLEKAGIDRTALYLFDGAGSDDHTRTSPAAFVKWLEFAKQQPWGAAFVDALPIMGVDGSLADVERNGSSMGKVRAKTGTRATSTPTGEVLLYAKSLAGYLEAKSGRTYLLVIAVNGVPIEGIEDIVRVVDDLGAIASALQQAN